MALDAQVINFDCLGGNATLELTELVPSDILGSAVAADASPTHFLAFHITENHYPSYFFQLDTGTIILCDPVPANSASPQRECVPVSLSTVTQGRYISELLEMKLLVGAMAYNGWSCKDSSGAVPQAANSVAYLDHIVTALVKSRLPGLPL